MCEPNIVSCDKRKQSSSDCLVCSKRNHCPKCKGLSDINVCMKCLFYSTGLCDGRQPTCEKSKEETPKNEKNKRKKKQKTKIRKN